MIEEKNRSTDKPLNLSKQKINFLQRSLSKSKYISLKQKKQIGLALTKNKKLLLSSLRKIFLSRALSRKITLSLMKSGLNFLQIKIILSFLKQILKQLFSRPFDRIPLGELKKLWHLLPNNLKQLLIAIQILKDEMMHRHRLEFEKNNLKKIDTIIKNNSFHSISIEEERAKFFPEIEMSPVIFGEKENKKQKNQPLN